MKSKFLENQRVYQNATLGIYGHKIISTGQTSDAAHEFIAVTALEDSVISYAKAKVQFNTYGDDTVTLIPVLAGMTLIVGAVKDLYVDTGKVLATLITQP